MKKPFNLFKNTKNMKIQIDNTWQSDSILFTFMENKIIDKNKVNDFRNFYLRVLQDGYDDSLQDIIKDFKDNISLFVKDLSYKDEIDFNLFLYFLEKVEKFYQKTIEWEFFGFRYYQYLTLFYTFIFFSLKDNNAFKLDYLDYINKHTLKKIWSLDIESQLNNDFKRLGYWMATWSWKTLLMYATVYMYILFENKKWNNLKDLFIIVPSDELRKQHKWFLTKFLTAWLWNLQDNWTIIDFNHISLFADIEISWKLTTYQWIKEDLPANSILLIDEAHKWAWLDKEWWLEDIKQKFLEKENTFMFEYSATFQKAFEKELNTERNIFNSYILSSIYKYNLYDFNVDGFGKNYHLESIKKWEDTKMLILKSLANFYKQLKSYKEKEKQPIFNKKWAYLENHKWQRIYKPLYVWLSYKLDSDTKNTLKDGETSLKDILKSIFYIFNNLNEYEEELSNLDVRKENFFEIFMWEKYTNWKANFSIFYDKSNDEIKIFLWKNIMLINTGQNKKIAESLVSDTELAVYANNELLANEELFSKIDSNENILFLFGSRKFVEWWDSKRPSTILLFKMWKTWTIVATQILWRWIRLYWIKWDGFRHLNSKTLESINIFGYDIDTFKSFIESLSDELYKIVVVKKVQFAKSFWNYAKNIVPLWNDERYNFKKINDLFKRYFFLLDEHLPKRKVVNKTKILDVKNEDWKLIFLWEGEKFAEISSKYEFITTISETDLLWWKVSSNSEKVNAKSYTLWFREEWLWVFTNNVLKDIIKQYFEMLKLSDIKNWTDEYFEISTSSYDDFINFIAWITISTDKFNQWYDNHFDIEKRKEFVNYFIDKMYWILNKVKNKLTYKVNWDIIRKIKPLEAKNLVDKIKLVCKLNKEEDKEIINLFFGDSSKIVFEKEYDDLTEEQKDILIKYFIQSNNKDLHIYDRLFYIDNKEFNQNFYHQIEWELKNYDIIPSELKLNKNEESKITNILNAIANSNTLRKKYDIFYLRNIRWKKWNYLFYEDRNWKYVKFYPDFIFWFINKNDDKDITIVYYEPKWKSIDVNDKLKSKKLKEISFWNIDSSILHLFGIKSTDLEIKDYNKGINIKILWVLEKE